jgi:hypothetical protein
VDNVRARKRSGGYVSLEGGYASESGGLRVLGLPSRIKIRTRGRSMRLSIPWMIQAISYIAIAIFLFNAYKSKRQKYIKLLALFFLVFGLVAFLILVISAITQMFFR